MTGGKLPQLPLIEPGLVAAWLKYAETPDDPRWPSPEIIDRAAPGLAAIINRQASPRVQFAGVRLPTLDTDGLDPDLRRELVGRESELAAKLSRPVKGSTSRQEAARHRDVLERQSIRIRLGLPLLPASAADALRPGPKVRHWQRYDYVKGLGEAAKQVLVEAGARPDISAGGQADGIVARFLAKIVLSLYPDERANPAMIARIINRSSQKH